MIESGPVARFMRQLLKTKRLEGISDVGGNIHMAKVEVISGTSREGRIKQQNTVILWRSGIVDGVRRVSDETPV